MTAPVTIESVVEAGLCTGCGLCESLAGRDRVEMGINIRGNMRPLVREPLEPELEAQILKVCPGVSVQGAVRTTGRRKDPTWGPIEDIARTWATDGEVRHHGAGGGTLSALSEHLLATGEVAAVLHVEADPERPYLTRARVSRSSEDLAAGAQSRYGPAAPLVHVRRLLDAGEMFAVVAKPCDVTAIRALQREDPRARRQIPYLLTIFCGGVHNAHVPRAIMRHHGVDEREVAVFRYRGDGWPGPLRVQTRAGETHDMTYTGAWLGRPWKYDLQFRCKICPDAIGEAADISVPDGWIMRDGKPLHDDAPGVNISIARTEAGRRLLHVAAAAGRLALAPMDADELDAMHYNHLPRRQGALGQHIAMRVMRQPSLRVTHISWFRAARAGGLRVVWRQFAGTVRRVLAGENREPLI